MLIFSVWASLDFQKLSDPNLGLFGLTILIASCIYLIIYSLGKLTREFIKIQITIQKIQIDRILLFKRMDLGWDDIEGYHLSSLTAGSLNKPKIIEVLTIHLTSGDKIDIVEYYFKNYSELSKLIRTRVKNYLGYQEYKHGLVGRRYSNKYVK